MILYRLAKQAFAKDLSGNGAKLCGGRWNSKGVALIYTSENRALCTAEIALHTPLGIVPTNYCLISIEVPDKLKILELDISQLKNTAWKSHPPNQITQKIGDDFARTNKYLVLKVPSVIVQGEYNYLINPMHPLASKIVIKNIEPFTFDDRMFSR